MCFYYKSKCPSPHFRFRFDLLCLTPLSAIFQIYHDDQFLVVKEAGVPGEKTTDHGQATDKLYHLRLRVKYTLFVIYIKMEGIYYDVYKVKEHISRSILVPCKSLKVSNKLFIAKKECKHSYIKQVHCQISNLGKQTENDRS